MAPSLRPIRKNRKGDFTRSLLPRDPEGRVDDVEPGDQTWSYPWPADDAIDPAAPVRDLATRTELWPALGAAVPAHVGVALDTLGQLLDASHSETPAFADATYRELAADLHTIIDPLAAPSATLTEPTVD